MYSKMGRFEESLQMDRDVYSERLKLDGEEDKETLGAAGNYASSLYELQHFEEARSLLRKITPAARHVFGENNEFTLKMRKIFADSLYNDDDATLDDLREAVSTLEDSERIARRVLGGAHPLTVDIEGELQRARAALAARETPPPPPPSKSV